MSITAELAKQIKQELDNLGSSDNAAIDTVAKKLGLDEDQILSYMFNDIEESVAMWGDDTPSKYVEPSLRVDHSVGVITSETYVAPEDEEEDEEDDTSMPPQQPMQGNTPWPAPSPFSSAPSSGDPLVDLAAEMALMCPDVVPEELELDEEGDVIPPEDPTAYVFAPWDNSPTDKGFSIFLKSFWDKNNCVDSRSIEPEFLMDAGFECVSESMWEMHAMPHSSAIKVLRNMGLTEITLP